MKKPLGLALALAAALALPVTASAKGQLVSVDICGPDGCKNYTDKETLGTLGSFGDGSTTSGPPPSPFYQVRLTFKGGEEDFTSTQHYVPSAGMLSVKEVGWVPASSGYEAAARGVEPFPTPKLKRVLVNGRATEDPGSYLALFTAGTTRSAVPPGIPEWVPVDMRFEGDSPWSGAQSILFSPEYGVIQRDSLIVKIPRAMAENIRAGRGIGVAEDGFGWATAALIALALVGAAVLAALTLRRPPLPRAKRAAIPA